MYNLYKCEDDMITHFFHIIRQDNSLILACVGSEILRLIYADLFLLNVLERMHTLLPLARQGYYFEMLIA